MVFITGMTSGKDRAGKQVHHCGSSTHLLGSIMHQQGSALVDSLQRFEVAVQSATAPMLHQLCKHHLH